MSHEYDVIIAGASFAGLAVAAQLRGRRMLVLDHQPIGAGQTSACGVPVATLKALNLEDAILQIHHALILHTPDRSFVYPVPHYPYCTFDYEKLCRLLWERATADFVEAPALGVEGHQVRTSKGEYTGRVIVDASGWRAVLASSLRADWARGQAVNFGLESTVPYADEGLHFAYDPKRLGRLSIAWIFPINGASRIGIGRYEGETQGTLRLLDLYLADLGQARRRVHGGYFTYRLRDPILEHLFLVGDAAGQCLPLTGEGIRPALYFGTQLGRLLRQHLEGKLSLEQTQKSYRRLVLRYKKAYDLLYRLQRLLPRLPLPVLQTLMDLGTRPGIYRRTLRRYFAAFALDDGGQSQSPALTLGESTA